MKERIAVFQILKELKNDSNQIILLSGLRRTGKTTVLKQLNRRIRNSVYVDCRDKESDSSIISYLKDEDIILLLDEYQYIDNCYEFSKELSIKVNACKRFKVIITSSSIQFIKALYQTSLGGGRSNLIRLPLFTFLEYLYFNGRINSYNSSLENINEQDFINYSLQLNNGPYPFPDIDMGYIETMVQENDIAANNLHLAVLSESVTREVILNLFKLINSFSLSISAKEISGMDSEIISQVLYFLLVSDMGVAVRIRNSNEYFSLFKLSKGLSKNELTQLFKSGTIIVNPLIFSALSISLKKYLNIEFDVDKMRALHGHWVESYIHNAYSLRTSFLILESEILKDFDNSPFPEVDIYDYTHNVAIECKVGNRKISESHFDKFEESVKSTCIMTTKDKFEIVEYKGNLIHRVPYYILAAVLDNPYSTIG